MHEHTDCDFCASSGLSQDKNSASLCGKISVWHVPECSDGRGERGTTPFRCQGRATQTEVDRPFRSSVILCVLSGSNSIVVVTPVVTYLPFLSSRIRIWRNSIRNGGPL